MMPMNWIITDNIILEVPNLHSFFNRFIQNGMIGIDTNVMVRCIIQDDPQQAAATTRLIEKACSLENPGYIT
jgi:hypothetical protein